MGCCRMGMVQLPQIEQWPGSPLAVADRALIYCTTQMAAGLWPPNPVSLEKCHRSPYGVCNYADGAQELTDKVETEKQKACLSAKEKPRSWFQTSSSLDKLPWLVVLALVAIRAGASTMTGSRGLLKDWSAHDYSVIFTWTNVNMTKCEFIRTNSWL
ncbi:hypothetical protein AAES_164218 [Amazona aestiva]|uniref:Uncharacterized protein n=1 Tax=Amazona aestiva TaxID=12930 RepID=A0A0Q3QKY8_AMAAE|nr:hypothetical protein AAES_164218 [Amazona aestiva]